MSGFRTTAVTLASLAALSAPAHAQRLDPSFVAEQVANQVTEIAVAEQWAACAAKVLKQPGDSFLRDDRGGSIFVSSERGATPAQKLAASNGTGKPVNTERYLFEVNSERVVFTASHFRFAPGDTAPNGFTAYYNRDGVLTSAPQMSENPEARNIRAQAQQFRKIKACMKVPG